MFWHRLGRLDRMLMVLAALVFLLSSYFVIEDHWMLRFVQGSQGHLEKIGFVKVALRDIRRRHHTALSWLPLEVRSPVFQGDSIFTGDRSEAVIQTEQGEQISISPHSLVVINSKTDSLQLNINYGSVLGKVGKHKKFFIATEGQLTELKGDDAVVKVDVDRHRKFVVNVLKGEVEISSSQGRQTIGPEQQLQLDDTLSLSSTQEIKLELLSPVSERIFSPEESQSMVLSWRSSFPLHEYWVEIARDPGFHEILVRSQTAETLYRPTGLPFHEKLYWRVLAHQGTSKLLIQSSHDVFMLTEDRPPVVIFPLEGQEFSFEEQPDLMDGHQINLILKWESYWPAKNWQVQLATDRDMTSELKTFSTQETWCHLDLLGEGLYYVRVRTQDWPQAPWSEIISFSIKQQKSTQLRAPRLVEHTEEFDLVTRLGDFDKEDLQNVEDASLETFVEALPEWSWSEVPGATHYELEIGHDPQFDTLFFKSEISSTWFVWSQARPGTFYWRIRSIYPEGMKSAYTDTQKIVVRIAPPRPVSQNKVVEESLNLSQMESPPPPFLLRWSPTIYSFKYELEFDKTPQFSQPLRVITSYPFKKVQVPNLGLYYWRVRALGVSLQPVSSWTEALELEFQRKFLTAETTKELKLISPLDETLMLIGEGRIKINFKWLTPFKNGVYRFQLSRDQDFSDLKIDFLTRKDHFLLRQNLTDGWYYWRLRSESEVQKSDWTHLARFQIKHEKKSFNFLLSETLQIKKMKLAELRKRKEEKIRLELAHIKKKKRWAQVRQLAAIEATRQPQLEAPQDLKGPARFALEFGTLPSVSRKRLASHVRFDDPTASKLLALPHFEWKAVEDSTFYKIEFSQDKSFTKIEDSYEVHATTFRWPRPRPGSYYWRVQSLGHPLKPSFFSEAHPIQIETSRPELLTPHALFLKTTRNNSTKQVQLKWTPVPFAQQYEVEWWLETQQKTQMDRQVLVSDVESLTLPILNEGQYYWRVQPLGGKRQIIGPASGVRPLHLEFEEGKRVSSSLPTILFPEQEKKIEYEEGESPSLNFSWTSPPIAGNFVVEFSEDEDFKKLIDRSVTKKQFLMKEFSQHHGFIYWRLRISVQGKILWKGEVQKLYFKAMPPREELS